MAALPWAPLAPFSPQSTGTPRRGDGRRVAAAAWWGSRSSKVLGSVALAAGLMGLQQMCFNIIMYIVYIIMYVRFELQTIEEDSL